jgi:hypothetical protein
MSEKIIFGNNLGVSGTTQFGGLSHFVSGITGTVFISGDILPTTSNQYVIGTTGGYGWKDIYIGPGSLHIQGPLGFTGEATLGSDAGGIAYTRSGFATPFINIGPDIEPVGITGVIPPRSVGGWNLSATGTKGSTSFDLVVQQNTPEGLTGPVYSLVKNFGPTGPTGSTGNTGATGPVAGSANQVVYKNSSNEPSGSANFTFNGSDLSVIGKVQSTFTAGDEGGEFFLNKASTNTTLETGVTIDIWQNRLRFFEQGASARGYYLDISEGSNSVDRNIVQKRLVVQGNTGNGASEGGITHNTWTTRKLNNSSTNGCFIDITNASLSSNQLTLPSGSYYVDISAPGHGVDSFAIRLQGITGTSVSINGTCEFSTSSGGAVKFGQTRSIIKGKIVLATSTVLEVQMYCTTTNSSDGLGHEASIGINNIYTIFSAVKLV